MKFNIFPHLPPAINLTQLLTNPLNKVKVTRDEVLVDFIVTFKESCLYTLQNVEDRLDFNKVAGIKFHYFNTMKDTAMIGWRANLETREIEILPYWHVNGSREFDESKIIKVPINKSVNITYNINYITKTVHCSICRLFNGKTILKDKRTFTYLSKNFYIINAWFGGTSLPPSQMEIEIQTKIF